MDTDDLTEMSYGLIVQGARVSDTLKSELGAMSRDFENENDWLRDIQKHCREICDDA